MLRRTLFLHPDAPAQAPPAIAPVTPERRADDFTARMIAEHGTIEHALRATAGRMFAAQDSLATVTGERDTLRAKLPEGAVVLPKAEAETFATLKALGTPAEITAKVKRADELETTVATTSAKEQARAVATAGQLDPEAFVDYALRVKLPMELRDVQTTEHGKTVTKKMPFVRNPADEKAAFVPVSDYVGSLPAHEQRALQASAPATPTGQPY
ncbi:MAG TPA: hypothetical protein VGP44_12830, partial [Gemmatimonadales bacterium]|nr:hypothetical protein [Gemmatimonadales bacterium]